VCGAFTPGPIFTTSGTANAIHFMGGSTLSVSAGCNPFGLTQPSSKIVLDSGSFFVFSGGGNPDLDGRTYGHFRFNVGGGAVCSAAGAATLTMEDLVVNAGTLNIGMTGAFNLKGNVTVHPTAFNHATLNFNAASAATVALNGTSLQTITVLDNGGLTATLDASATETFTVNNASGIALGSNVTLPNGTLSFVSGNLTTGANTLAIAATAGLTGAGTSTGWVVGNLKRNVPLGGARVFDIGSASNYLPVPLQVNGLASAFDLTARMSTPDHAQLATSELNPAKSVNRYWTLTPATTPTFTDYSATFNFEPGDVDGGANTANLLVARYDGAWTTLAAGTRTSTSTQATGVTAFSDFAVAEEATHTITASAGTGGTIAPIGDVPVTDGASQGFTMTPDPGYYISDVLVDGVSVGAVASYTFTAVTLDHTIAASFATGCLAPPANLVAWWAFDEASDPTAIDLVGPAHGAFVGGASHQPGQVAGCIHLANSTQYMTAADDPSLNFGTGNFSIDAWVRSNDASTSVRTILDKRSSASGTLIGYSVFISFGHLGVQLADASGFSNFASSTGNLVDGAWHLVTVTVDRASATGGKLYVDGALSLTFNPTVRPGSLTNVGPVRIGQAYNSGSIGFQRGHRRGRAVLTPAVVHRGHPALPIRREWQVQARTDRLHPAAQRHVGVVSIRRDVGNRRCGSALELQWQLCRRRHALRREGGGCIAHREFYSVRERDRQSPS
jgi:hypothetical protein